MDESNRLRPGVPPQGARTSYNLWRWDPYLSLSYKDLVTGYVQGIEATAFGYDPPLSAVAIDTNEWDLLRYYAEINLGDIGNGNLKYRYGRQFLIYGSQHLLSNLGWGNTFRNFEGHRFFYQAEDWKVDGFAMNSVNGAAGGTNFSPVKHDREDRDRQMNGLYTTYTGLENNTFDFYWLWSLEKNRNLLRQGGDRHTVGMRWAGTRSVSGSGPKDIGAWNWDLEGAYQFGQDSYGNAINANVQAGFFSGTGGYTFTNLPWSPSINGLFWWGSGDSNPNDNRITTVYTLYPLGHAYWGLIDNLDGQNLLDYSVSASVKPAKTVTLTSAWHWFDRANTNDAVYNVVGGAFAQGAAGKNIGNELDLVATYKITPQMNLQVGYFWFWYGAAINNGAPRPDASQFYAQTIIGF
ncbi:MAG: alginate export family protein [Planctomycetes bacterium]|nr:alginate export family protein [Planctomycetota bacterium]